MSPNLMSAETLERVYTAEMCVNLLFKYSLSSQRTAGMYFFWKGT